MKLYHVDAFTDRLFAGNPAGVCILYKDIPDAQKLQIAAELKHSETAFVLLPPDNGKILLRWFTPLTEVPLCGHATLSAAHILFENDVIPQKEQIIFSTRSGILTAKKLATRIELDFPQIDLSPCANNSALNSALGVTPLFVAKNDALYFIEIASALQLRKLKPDFSALQSIIPGEFILTAVSDDPQYDFISRFFAPAIGIPEDPVTGSAHCYLAPYWSGKLGKKKMTAHQASPRGGTVECELVANKRLKLRGSAVTFYETDIF
ncbi:MAG: PhzF family phenazine biosynthesis isomerase [Candidatus Neomarinimicrobiota bacterium]|jgi:PhzF family phenazine biosynthesis protein|nr:PhzF family phenazine biosynthesis isomerase [Candidatus Neomarinimicrobiota bacterium]MDX9781087.1 PhzF family phenazine biosynthesis isomerase [bacterium]